MTIAAPRDLQRWMSDRNGALAELGVAAVFGRGMRLDPSGKPPSSWVSFVSAVGSGRLVRDDDGTCHLHAQRHSDGIVMVDRSCGSTTTEELEEVVRALSASARVR